MGLAIAARLAAVGPVTAFDPDPARRPAASALGVTVADSPDAVALAARTVVLSLPNPAVSFEVITAVKDVWAAGEVRGGTIIETSTVTPDDVKRCHAACTAAGALFVDAAILS